MSNKDRIIELIEQGKNIAEIREMVNVGDSYIYGVAKRARLKITPPKTVRQTLKERFADLTEKFASVKDMAKALDTYEDGLRKNFSMEELYPHMLRQCNQPGCGNTFTPHVSRQFCDEHIFEGDSNASVKRRAERVNKLKKKCEACGFKGPPQTFVFHHKDPTTKVIEVSNALAQGWSWNDIKKEIDKCIVLCANCHNLLHHTDIETSFDNVEIELPDNLDMFFDDNDLDIDLSDLTLLIN